MTDNAMYFKAAEQMLSEAKLQVSDYFGSKKGIHWKYKAKVDISHMQQHA